MKTHTLILVALCFCSVFAQTAVYKQTCTDASVSSSDFEDIMIGADNFCINKSCFADFIKIQNQVTFTYTSLQVPLTNAQWNSECVTVTYNVYALGDDNTSLANKNDVIGNEIGGVASGTYRFKFDFKIKGSEFVLFTLVDQYGITTNGSDITAFSAGSVENNIHVAQEKALDTPPARVDDIPYFTIGNKQNAEFNADDTDPVVFGGDIRYTLTSVLATDNMDTSTYTVTVLSGEDILATYTNSDSPQKVTFDVATGNTIKATISGLDLIGAYTVKIQTGSV